MHVILQELQAHYDEVQRQLQVTLDQLGISQRRLQSLTAELEEVRGNYESVSIVESVYVERKFKLNRCAFKGIENLR